MSKRVSIIALASPVHPQVQRVAALKRFLKVMEDSGLEIDMITEPISSVEEVWAVKHKILDLDRPLLVLHLTGGTSKLAVEVAKWCNSTITLIAHNESNSLPSSLEARARIRRLGLDVELKLIDSINGKLQVKSEVYDFKGCVAILGEVSPRTFDISCPAIIARRLKVKVKQLTQDELERYLEKHRQSAELVHEFLSRFRGKVDVPTRELQLSLALKEAVGDALEKVKCDVFTIDCFEVMKRIHVTPCLAISLLSANEILGVCEADLQAAACMMSMRELTQPFMGNIAAVKEEDTLILAHCTAPITLASSESDVKLKSHFETNESVAVDVPIRQGMAVMVGCDPQLKSAYVVECYVDGSQLELKNLCRTQVAIKLKSKTLDVLSKWPSGHAVLAVQVSLAEAKRVLAEKGFEVVEL
ncbi:MAG: hypothetical protein QE164_00310 [Candidatus Nezhaarchaeota archaeon]|nr:hypothetical protein [Candidatus Nezhaarchaeota archaeon]